MFPGDFNLIKFVCTRVMAYCFRSVIRRFCKAFDRTRAVGSTLGVGF